MLWLLRTGTIPEPIHAMGTISSNPFGEGCYFPSHEQFPHTHTLTSNRTHFQGDPLQSFFLCEDTPAQYFALQMPPALASPDS